MHYDQPKPIDYSAILEFTLLRRNDPFDRALAGRNFSSFRKAIHAVQKCVTQKDYERFGYSTFRRFFKDMYGIHNYVLGLYLASAAVYEVSGPLSRRSLTLCRFSTGLKRYH